MASRVYVIELDRAAGRRRDPRIPWVYVGSSARDPEIRFACRAELERAHELAGCGFVAHCDGTSYGKEEADWAEWDAERLEPVGHLADEAATELYEASFRPLNADRCARLLHGERGFWVPEFIDQLDPPPGYGLFAHVRLAVLESRVAELAPSEQQA